MDWTRGHTLGRGSSATVSQAIASHSGDVFAVKSTELSNSQFLQKEEQILSSLISPYIVQYRGSDITLEENKLIYNLFMEYAAGGSLSDTIRERGGRLEEFSLVNFTRQILYGLHYLHSSGIVHCDIKGRNVLISKGDSAKIADFGCAKQIGLETDAATPISGTPAFMAPEVVRGELQSFESDIWSLGCTVIEMATGSVPWRDAADPVSVLYRIGYSGESPAIPEFLSAGAKDFLEKCLRRNPEERWSAGELMKHLWIAEFSSIDSQNCSSSSSPTSILDQRIWNSLEESGSLENLSRSSSDDSAKERIGRFSSISVGPSWDDEDVGWITIRESNGCDFERVERCFKKEGKGRKEWSKIVNLELLFPSISTSLPSEINPHKLYYYL